MTLGKPLPPADHVARYVKNSWIATDPETGITIPDPDAFKPRVLPDKSIEKEISGNHVEFFTKDSVAGNVAALEVHLRGIGQNLKKWWIRGGRCHGDY
jgi:hypothetical protein